MPYTGNLIRIAQEPDARKLPAPSVRHGANEADPALAHGEHVVPAGTGSEYAGTAYPQVVMGGFGMPLDTPASWASSPPGGPDETPYAYGWTRGNPHDSRAVLSAAGAAAAWYGDGNRARAHDGALDRGVARVRFSPEPMWANTQRRDQIMTEGLPGQYSPDGGPRWAKHARGINSLPENNPPRDGYGPGGFRQGLERVRAWDNTVFASISRHLGIQLLGARPGWVPRPARPMVGPMTTPPALPRDPGNPDDTFYARTVYPPAASSVIGGGF